MVCMLHFIFLFQHFDYELSKNIADLCATVKYFPCLNFVHSLLKIVTISQYGPISSTANYLLHYSFLHEYTIVLYLLLLLLSFNINSILAGSYN